MSTPKYKNKITRGYHSRKEANRAWQLKQMQNAGIIFHVREQVRYPLYCNDLLICEYVADFVYMRGEETIVEDVKSEGTVKTREFAIKRKLFIANYGHDITVFGAKAPKVKIKQKK